MKNAFILLTSRIIKLVANLLKLLCYPFHALFPGKRFTLPEAAPPLLATRKPTDIPRILWQTNFTGEVTLPVYLNYLFNRLMAPHHEYRFMVTEAREHFIREHYSTDILEHYSWLQIGAAQADFWRLLVLQKYGGVYLDIDAHLVWPMDGIVRPGMQELYITNRRGEISNYFIVSRPDNPHLADLIKAVRDNIDENLIRGVYDLTGPGVFNRILKARDVDTVSYRYACNQGSFTNEHFQYIDKAEGKWTRQQKSVEVVKRPTH
ncbi:MAG: glycosyltransferase [Halomonas sp.]|uniref:glycosyltransferase family 32 protein n=1 Tax=Halomonas sp. TaxID=1486246 RepID=UPI00286FB903|nr:glycosyltransferase [Halomonas sp.]MDR9438276.1 glycosyltransferase [Halomonas sp.]